MKLSLLSEADFLTALKKSIGKTYFERPGLHTILPQDGNRGNDSGSRAQGFNYLTTGTPRKGKHRRYFGIAAPNSL
jgi:hypothetical protein